MTMPKPLEAPVAVPTGPVPAHAGPELLERLAGRIALVPGPHATAPVLAPFTGRPLREVPLGTAEDIGAAVRRAREAQRAWAARSFSERARVFLRYHDLVLERQAEGLDVIQMENGKARNHAFEEIADNAIVARHYARHAEAYLGPRRRKGALPALTSTRELHHPLGVVGIISPWNYPLSLSITDAIAALMAGNAVVIKPDQQTPFSALWGLALLEEAGLPPGVFQIVTGRGRDLGGPLIQAADYVCFTGSTATGRVIARQAAERLIGCSLELGGKNPMIVLDDADLEKAARGSVRGCFANTGQLCISIERMYVHSCVHDVFLSRFVELVRALSLGASYDYDRDMGSLASAAQLEKMSAHVKDAVDKGAKIAAGGRARPDLGPWFHEPTILTGVTDEMDVAKEETFGPLVSVYKFDSEDEVVAKANATPYGLNASVWTRDAARGVRLAERIQAGTVNVNEAYAAAYASVDAPMGGFKDSGIGRRHGEQGIRKYTAVQTVSVQRLVPLAAPPGVGEKRYSEIMTGALKVLARIPGVR